MSGLNITRRRVLCGLLAAPLIVAVGNVMPVRAFLPVLWGDGIHDDTDAIQARLDFGGDSGTHLNLLNKTYRITRSIALRHSNLTISDGHLVLDRETLPTGFYAIDCCGGVKNLKIEDMQISRRLGPRPGWRFGLRTPEFYTTVEFIGGVST